MLQATVTNSACRDFTQSLLWCGTFRRLAAIVADFHTVNWCALLPDATDRSAAIVARQKREKRHKRLQ